MNIKKKPLLKQKIDLWHTFQEKNSLSDHQIEQFKTYAQMLIEWNKKFNITTITDLPSIIKTHFQDSLSLIPYLSNSSPKGLCDIGAGGGFPGLPIKIARPDLFMVLVEVNQKKVTFLHEVIRALGLSAIEVCDLDWRTFLRKTDYPIDLFCARASLSIKELLRVFKADSPYRNAQLVYWASAHYTPEQAHEKYVHRVESYQLSSQQRRLVFFKGPDSQ